MIDLHLHSVFSDGTCSVEEIIAKAEELGLTQIAITDHNVLDGSILAHKKSKIESIVAIEMSVDYKGTEIHLLGYFPNDSDYKHVKFVIKESIANKKLAIMQTVENLNDMGFNIQVTELNEFGKGSINRVHVCKAMIKHGYIKTVKEGFDKYVGDTCPAYVHSKRTTLADAIEAIHKDGGLAIIAHPYEYEHDLDSIDDFLYSIMDDIDGIECFHPSANKKQSRHLLEIANDNNKVVTGGSDFHGENKPNITMNMMYVEDRYKIAK